MDLFSSNIIGKDINKDYFSKIKSEKFGFNFVSEDGLSQKDRLNSAILSARSFINHSKKFDNNSKVRLKFLQSLRQLVVENKEQLSKLEANLALKRQVDARKEVEILLQHLDFSIELLERHTFFKKVYSNPSSDFYQLEVPVGVIGLIVPYNFPLVVVAERLPYMLAAGCSVIIKPSEVSSGCLPFLVYLIWVSGFDSGSVSIVHGGTSIGNSLVSSDFVDMVSFTGSTKIGRVIALNCAKTFKKTSLELGGNNYAIVLSDADLDKAALEVANGFLYHNGQCCISTRIVVIDNSIYKKFIELLRGQINTTLKETSYVELCDKNNMNAIRELNDKLSVNMKELLECNLSGNSKDLLNPKIYEQVDSFEDFEIFGPILRVIKSNSIEESVRFVEKSSYGLALQIFTKSSKKYKDIVSLVNVGRVWVNSSLESNPRLRIGGYGESGNSFIGGDEALSDYLTTKSVTLDKGSIKQ